MPRCTATAGWTEAWWRSRFNVLSNVNCLLKAFETIRENDSWTQTCWRFCVCSWALPGVQSPVKVPPELLLVLGVDHVKHTLVHHISLTGETVKTNRFKRYSQKGSCGSAVGMGCLPTWRTLFNSEHLKNVRIVYTAVHTIINIIRGHFWGRQKLIQQKQNTYHDTYYIM